MAKKKSKLKSALKKIGKAAAVAGAGYLAMKGLKGRRENDAYLASEGGDRSKSKSKFLKPSIGMVTDGSNQYMPKNLSKSMGYKSDKYEGTPLRRIQKQSEGIDGISDPMSAKDGGRAKHKSGGSVKKSMGKALRGGGKVIR